MKGKGERGVQDRVTRIKGQGKVKGGERIPGETRGGKATGEGEGTWIEEEKPKNYDRGRGERYVPRGKNADRTLVEESLANGKSKEFNEERIRQY